MVKLVLICFPPTSSQLTQSISAFLTGKRAKSLEDDSGGMFKHAEARWVHSTAKLQL